MTTDRRFFEDIEPGETAVAGPVVLTREDIRAFARLYDPQPFHLDEAVANASLLGGLAASGWHTAAIGMRLYYDAFVQHVASMGAPGVEEVRWLKPVGPDNPLTLRVTIGDKRESKTRSDRGFISVVLDLRDGTDTCMMTQRFSMMVQRRGQVVERLTPPPIVTVQTPSAPPADLGLTDFFEDVVVGVEMPLGSQLFTPDAIVDFARAYDPQPFHLDPEAAKATMFGGLCASGWQTAAFWMKAYIDTRERSGAARLAAGLPGAVGGPSPGFNAMKWLRPVYANETIAYALKVTAKRPMTRPGWGLIVTENYGRAADGTLVMSVEGRMLWPLRPA